MGCRFDVFRGGWSGTCSAENNQGELPTRTPGFATRTPYNLLHVDPISFGRSAVFETLPSCICIQQSAMLDTASYRRLTSCLCLLLIRISPSCPQHYISLSCSSLHVVHSPRLPIILLHPHLRCNGTTSAWGTTLVVLAL